MFELGKIISELREKRGWTQAYMGEVLGGYDRSIISQWEGGHSVPGDEVLYTIERLAGLPRQYLVIRKRLKKMAEEGYDIAAMFNDSDLLEEFGVLLDLGAKKLTDAPSPAARHAAALAAKQNWTDLARLALDALDDQQKHEAPPNPAPETSPSTPSHLGSKPRLSRQKQ